jgi:yeast amino acid transporter
LGANPFINVAASPFVIAAKDAGLIGYDSFMNFIILISVISIGNSGVYGGSRTLTALAEQGYAPKIFAYIDRSGRPLFSTIAILVFGCLGYVNLSATGPVVFDWLLALSGLAALFTWGSICLAHIRFRIAWKHQGHTLDEIPFKAVFGVWGSYAGLVLIVLVLIAQVYPLSPISTTYGCTLTLLSSTPRFTLLVKMVLAPRKISSNPTLRYRLWLCSGFVGIFGSGLAG